MLILYFNDVLSMFEGVWGAAIGVWLAVLHRHVRNVILFYATDSGGISGRVEIKHWLSLRMSAVESLCFCGSFAALYALIDTPLLLGASIGCFLSALGELADSRKRRKATAEKQ